MGEDEERIRVCLVESDESEDEISGSDDGEEDHVSVSNHDTGSEADNTDLDPDYDPSSEKEYDTDFNPYYEPVSEEDVISEEGDLENPVSVDGTMQDVIANAVGDHSTIDQVIEDVVQGAGESIADAVDNIPNVDQVIESAVNGAGGSIEDDDSDFISKDGVTIWMKNHFVKPNACT